MASPLYRTAVTVLMICAVAVSGTVFPGIFSNTIDLAPNFSGKIFWNSNDATYLPT